MPNKDIKDMATRAKRELVQFRRISGPGWIGGVCAGLAYRTGLPTWAIRLVWALLVLCKGVGVLAYVLLWIFVPKAGGTPNDYTDRTGDS